VPLSKSATDYLTKARDAYQKLVDDAAKDPKLAPNETSLLAAKVQLGECLRALGEYDKALDLFAAILAEKEASLAVQRSAALAYQQRGQREGAKFLEAAIYGGYKNEKTGQNRVWGWLRISQVAARASGTDPKFRDSFFEARLNLSKCRYLAAMKQTGDERKQDLDKARQSIESLARLYPDLGGERWKPQFDALLKSIERDENNLENAAG
jgi:tetratricopeptide (TPR) repeat protein